MNCKVSPILTRLGTKFASYENHGKPEKLRILYWRFLLRGGDYHRHPRETPAPNLDLLGRRCSRNPRLASRHRYPFLEVLNSSHWCKAVFAPISLSCHVRFPRISLRSVSLFILIVSFPRKPFRFLPSGIL